MKFATAIFSLLAAFAPAVFAQTDVSALLDTAAAVEVGDHKAWLEARNAIVAQGEAALPDLRAAAAEENWTREGWVRALAAEVCRVRIEKPEIATDVDSPQGLKPEHYKKFRKPEPFCQHDLVKLGLDASPLLLERWRWTFAAVVFSPGNAGELERNCFARAIMFVPGAVNDRRARFALEDVMRDGSLPDGWRQDATVSFGQTAGTSGLATLGEIFDDVTQSLAVREASGWAFGRVPSTRAADALKTRLTADGLSRELRRALLTGVAILGNSGGWKARGEMLQATGEEIRESCARMAIDALKAAPEDVDLVSRALSVTAWPDSLQWVRDLAEGAESETVRLAAATCVEPLQLAISRLK